MDELMQQTPGSTGRIDHPDVHRWVRPIFGTLTDMVLAGLPAHERRPVREICRLVDDARRIGAEMDVAAAHGAHAMRRHG
jgi:hypothetical protein